MKNTTIKWLSILTVIISLSSSCKDKTEERFGGLALYTVREQMNHDVENTLMQVSSDGYLNIEAAGYADGKFYGMSPEEFKALLEKNRLNPISSHQGDVTLENADRMIADVKAAGFKYFVIPVPPMGYFIQDNETHTMGMKNDLETLTSILNELGQKCEDQGLELLYHNHDFEFKPNEDGVIPIEYFLEHTDPKYVNFQMDLYWVTKAGADPVAYFNKYPGRFKAWHVKDMDTEGKFAPVGQGTIDFGKILENKDISGMKFYLVEQDNCFELNPMEAIRISRNGLKKFGFE